MAVIRTLGNPVITTIKLPTAIGHLTDHRMSAPRAFTASAGPFNRVAFAAAHDDPILGVVVDVYHVHWDPRLAQEIARAGSRFWRFTSATGWRPRSTCCSTET